MLREKYIVKRIVNNNIVIAENYKGQEVVAIGKGLGFRKSKYDTVFQNEVMKTYVLVEGSNKGQILSLFEQIPFEIIELTQRIIDMAQKELNVKFNVNLIVALSDHINFSVNQYKAGFDLPTLVNEEIKRFYKEEYQVGRKAIKMINETLNISLKDDESTSIAFHLITATEKRSNRDSLKIMKGVNEIIQIVEDNFSVKLDEDSLAYSRFIIHLKFFMKTILFDEIKRNDGVLASLISQVTKEYDKANRCVDKIADFVLENYNYQLSDEDRLYLVIHIVRILEQPQ